MPPYGIPWDESSPPGTIPADTIETEIQRVKISVRERLEQVVPDFGNDAVNPKKIGTGLTAILVGQLSARPATPAFKGQEYFASDTKRIFVGVETAPSVFAWEEVTAAVPSFPRAFIIDAGSPEFRPNGNETRATRVKNAIAAAAASGGTTVVVYVPKSLWGYVADADFNPTMYNPAVFLVREGSIGAWYDPVAYGADSSGAVDSAQALVATVNAAKAPVSPGTRVVAFTIAGTYRSDTNIDQGVGLVALFDFPGVTRTGTGNYTGTWAWIVDDINDLEVSTAATRPASGKRAGHAHWSVDTKKLTIWDGDSWEVVNPDPPTAIQHTSLHYDTNAAAGTRATAMTVARILNLRVRGTADGSGNAYIEFSEAGLSGYTIATLLFVQATENTRTGGAYTTSGSSGALDTLVDHTNNRVKLGGLGGGDNFEVFVQMGFSA